MEQAYRAGTALEGAGAKPFTKRYDFIVPQSTIFSEISAGALILAAVPQRYIWQSLSALCKRLRIIPGRGPETSILLGSHFQPALKRLFTKVKSGEESTVLHRIETAWRQERSENCLISAGYHASLLSQRDHLSIKPPTTTDKPLARQALKPDLYVPVEVIRRLRASCENFI
jgi:hypothetical protein